ncbi:MAG TPA: BlaI/MecI/CopY family transcriptional regulator [Lacipirellulaceae bacterium]|jgi:predicted transcriptional regulator|nr:BlaI/MecI/CopY family transcriptional regulator [Lacipirellulaceae bacterium]
MPRPPSSHPTDGELEILRVLWEEGSSPLGKICESLRRQREVATTTVATMLRVMLDKGLVRRKQAARAQQWSAAITQAATAKSMVGKLVDGVFDGSAGRLAAHLVEAGRLSNEELSELRELIESSQVSRKGAKAQR